MKLKVREKDVDYAKPGHDMTVIEVHLPIRTVSEANVREHWAVKAKRAKSQRAAAFLMLKRYRRSMNGKSLVVTLTRIGARKLDSDNLARSFKAIRDGIADALDIDDGSDRIEWKYAQQKGKPKEYAIIVRIESNV